VLKLIYQIRIEFPRRMWEKGGNPIKMIGLYKKNMDGDKQKMTIKCSLTIKLIIFLCLALLLTLGIICYLSIELKNSYKVKLDAIEIEEIAKKFSVSEDEVTRKYIYYQNWTDVKSALKNSLSNQEIIDFIKRGGTVKGYNTALCFAKNSDNSLRKALSIGNDRTNDEYFEIVFDKEDGSTIRKRKRNSNCEVIDFFVLTKGMTKEETIVALNCELPDIWKGTANFPESEAHYNLGSNSSVIIKYVYNENGIYEINKVLYCEGKNENILIQ